MKRPAFRFSVLAVMLLIACDLPCSAKTVYVRWDSPGWMLDGVSWDTAFHTVQAGLDASVSGDEVWVAKGTYVERITLKKGVSLYGGFLGDETSSDERNWPVNVTTLDGNQGGSVVTSPSGVTDTARIDGFTIRNGKATNGGGIYNHHASLLIENNTITGNSASYGGAIFCYYSSATVVSNTITGNSAVEGGAIYCLVASPLIANNTLAANSATKGGGVCCSSSSSPIVTNNTIVGNSGPSGGGIYCDYPGPSIANNIIAFNSSGIWSFYVGTPVLRNNCVYGNTGYNYYGKPPGIGDISVDPLLADNRYGNLHIRPESPCRNAGMNDAFGLPATDTDGQPRVQDGTVDIGADESDGTVWPAGPYAVVRVSPSGNDANDGSSWALAKRTVQAGIDTASELGGEVWVKAGTYNERIVLLPYAYLYGGFAGTENSRSEKEWSAGRTILDGGGAGSVVTAPAGPTASGIDGFTIMNGEYGIRTGGSPTITNNVITGNTADGIVCELGSSPAVTNNTIVQNASNGISYHAASSPRLSNNIVAFNSVGLCKDTAATGLPLLRNNDVYGNSASNYSGIGEYTGTNGNISADPLLADSSGHLTDASPCLNAGWNDAPGLQAIDMDGDLRVLEGLVDIGADEFTPTPVEVARLKTFSDNTRVHVRGCVVSAAFPQFLYVEADDRSSGIRVEKVGHTLTTGMRAEIIGAVSTNANGERYVAAHYAEQSALPESTGSVYPLILCNRDVGGGDLDYSPSTGIGQMGVKGRDSLNNIGLLVTTTGVVTHNPTGSYFVIHDGSSVRDQSGYKGIRVMALGLTKPEVGRYVMVTGISSIFKSGADHYPFIRVRTQTDIVIRQ